MSHFTNVQTKINDLLMLKKACDELNLEVEEDVQNLVLVRGFRGATTKADMVIRGFKTRSGKACSYDIGVQKVGEGYQLVADWWGIEEETGETQQVVSQRIIQKYAVNKVKKEVEKAGFSLDAQSVEQDGSVKLVAKKW